MSKLTMKYKIKLLEEVIKQIKREQLHRRAFIAKDIQIDIKEEFQPMSGFKINIKQIKESIQR